MGNHHRGVQVDGDQAAVRAGNTLRAPPQQFDPVTDKTIELTDVLWLNGNSIEAACEVESTTSIYSG
jgi:hypothetical protein